MSIIRKPRTSTGGGARRPNRKPLPFDDRLRQELLLQLKLPCPHCTMTPTINAVARVCGINQNTLWRFIRVQGSTMLRKHLMKVVEWLRKERGVEIEDPPSATPPAPPEKVA